jgi:O-antigen ligase
LKNYNLFGFGIGNFEYIYKKAFHKIINAPHNLFLDFLSNFGFLLLIYFIILLYKLYININKNFDKKILLMLKSSLFTLPFFSIIDSYFIQSPSTWIYFISLYLITVPQYD